MCDVEKKLKPLLFQTLLYFRSAQVYIFLRPKLSVAIQINLRRRNMTLEPNNCVKFVYISGILSSFK